MSEASKLGVFGMVTGLSLGFIIGYLVRHKSSVSPLGPSFKDGDDNYSASGRKSLRKGKNVTAKTDTPLWAGPTTQRGRVGTLPMGGDITFLTYEPNGWGKFRTIHYKDNYGNIVSVPRFVYINRVD